jgi:hypothetical protein
MKRRSKSLQEVCRRAKRNIKGLLRRKLKRPPKSSRKKTML